MKKILIIGNGLMGGSLGMVLERTGKYLITYYDKNEEISHISSDMDKISQFFGGNIAEKYDVVFNCTGGKIEKHINAPFIDISSIQHNKFGFSNGDNVIFCHPMCGSEKSGRENARADLYENQNCVITTEGKFEELIELATDIFKNDLKMNVGFCDTVDEHNLNVAKTSHLLHYLALDESFIHLKTCESQKIFQRLANSNKEMWEKIFEANKENLLKVLAEFSYWLAITQGQVPKALLLLTRDIPEHYKGTALKEILLDF